MPTEHQTLNDKLQQWKSAVPQDLENPSNVSFCVIEDTGKIEICFENWPNFFKKNAPVFQEELSASITKLRFENTLFGRSDLAALSFFPGIDELEFSNCALNNAASPSMSTLASMNKKFPKVKRIKIEHSSEVLIQEFQAYEYLETIELRHISKILDFNEFEKIEKLKEIHLEAIRIVSDNIKSIAKMRSLLKLRLIAFDISDLNSLATLTKLEELQLNWTPLKEFPSWIYNMENLKILDISHSSISRWIPESQSVDMINSHVEPLSKKVVYSMLQSKISERLKQLVALYFGSTPISELPPIGRAESLEILNFPNTQISGKLKDLPINLKELVCNHTTKLTDLPDNIQQLKQLRKLDISHTSISKMPLLSAFASLEYLNISDTKINIIPDGLEKLVSLKTLVLENLKFAQMHQGLLALAEKQGLIFTTEKVNDDTDGIFLAGTKTMDIDIRYLLKNDPTLVNEYFNQKRESAHRANLVFLGNGDKTDVICALFDVVPEDFIKTPGLNILNARAHIDSSKSTDRLAYDTVLTVWDILDEPKAQSGHGLFLTPEALYVIVLDPANASVMRQQAEYWINFVECSIVSAQILFLFRQPLSFVTNTMFSKLCTAERFFATRACAVMTNDDPSGAQERLMSEIKRMPTYTIKNMLAWKHLTRHSFELIEVRTMLLHSQFDDICKKYAPNMSKEMTEAFRRWLSESGILFDSGKKLKLLFSYSWYTNFVYSALNYAHQTGGIVSVNGLFEYLLDHSTQFDYFSKEIEVLLNSLSKILPEENQISKALPEENQISETSLEKEQLCYKVQDKTYIFPQFNRSFTSFSKPNISWDIIEEWITRIRACRYCNHYIIELPLLSETLFTDILCRLWTEVAEIKETRVFVGSGGIAISFPNTEEHGGGSLLMEAIPGVAGCIHIYASREFLEHSQHTAVQPQTTQWKGQHLNAYADFALNAVISSIANNRRLIDETRFWVMVNSRNLSIDDVREGRILLEHILYNKHSGRSKLDYFERTLPTKDLVEPFITQSYAEFWKKKTLEA